LKFKAEETYSKLAYDRFHLNLEALQVVLAESMADARLAAQVTTAASTKNHILARTNLVCKGNTILLNSLSLFLP